MNSIQSNTEKSWLEWIFTQRFLVYVVAIAIRVILSIFTIDQNDGPVFEDTSYDIIVLKTNIYNESSEHYLFNYFPLAYFAILPGMLIYYALDLDNLYLLRFFLKLPLISTDIALTLLLNGHHKRHHENNDPIKENKTNNMKEDVVLYPNTSNNHNSATRASRAELFILFHPFIIYTSSVKGQFDIIPVYFLMLAWINFEKQNYTRSGAYIATSILFKQYGVLFSYILGLSLLKTNYKKLVNLIGGHLLVTIPVLAIGALLNFDGMIYHAIEYHLERTSGGFSLAAIIYFFVTFLLRKKYDSIFSIAVGNLIIILFLISLIFVLIYRGYVLFLLNNVLWEQYFIIFMILWLEQKNINNGEILDTTLYWNYAMVPLTIISRVYFMFPPDVQNLFGEYWIEIIWFSGIFLHFFLMYIFTKKKIEMFSFWYIKVIYTVVLIIAPFHYIVMVNRDTTFAFFNR
ncbi:MAG: hypothetical protein ACW99Q_29720 [Candidatus Kariarchaeaceae archaeon]|jgi:hypothetical protein